jgi:Protein of unknown function (DUF2585)
MPEPIRNLFTRRTIWFACGLTIVFVGLLYLEGRPWWCKYGLGFWSPVWTKCTSQLFLDPYSLTHVLHGIIFYWLLRPFAANVSLHWRLIAALMLEIGWELLENSPWVIEHYRQDTASLDYTGDSIVNAIGDVVTTTIGFTIASPFSWKVAVAVFVVVELGLLFLMRDNLTLNVFMLFFPLESLKEWQLQAISS